MKKALHILAIIITFSLPITSHSSSQIPDTNAAELYIKNFASKIFTIITNKQVSTEATIKMLEKEIKENIDLNYICKFVIGKYWKTADKDFKAKFIELYQQYLLQTYAPQFKGYNGETYEILKTEEIRPGRFSTDIAFITKDKTRLNIVIYFIKNSDGKFKIVDMTGEGISLLASQREEFGSIISNHGLDYFLSSFQEKTQSLVKN